MRRSVQKFGRIEGKVKKSQLKCGRETDEKWREKMEFWLCITIINYNFIIHFLFLFLLTSTLQLMTFQILILSVKANCQLEDYLITKLNLLSFSHILIPFVLIFYFLSILYLSMLHIFEIFHLNILYYNLMRFSLR